MRTVLLCCLALLAVGWGAFGQNTFGLGASWFVDRIGLDTFLELPIGSNAVRLAISVMSFDPLLLIMDGSFLFGVPFGLLHLYLGGGAGLWWAPLGGGAGLVVPTLHALINLGIPITDTFSIYGQLKLLGAVFVGNLPPVGTLTPGFGLRVKF